jgi:membrane protein
VLESCRRALNVVFEVESGRSFLRRKAIDVLSAFVVLALTLVSLVLVFVGGGFADDLLGFIGLGSTAAQIWSIARWPAAVFVAMLVFSYLYYVTPDVQHRSFRWITPGAVAGVLLWLPASFGFSLYLSSRTSKRNPRSPSNPETSLRLPPISLSCSATVCVPLGR